MFLSKPWRKVSLFSFLLLAMFTKFSFETFTCPPSKDPLSLAEAMTYKLQICYNQVVISNKYRLSGGDSLQCTSTSEATIIDDDPSTLTEALCREIISVSPNPIFVEGQDCQHGYRLATVAEVSEPTTYNYLCNDILVAPGVIAKLEGGGSFRGWQHDPNEWDCPISQSEDPTGMGHCVCMPFENIAVVSAIVSTSETFSCSPPCTTCFGSSDYCTSCTSPYPILHNNDCLDACPPQTYESGGNCLRNAFLVILSKK